MLCCAGKSCAMLSAGVRGRRGEFRGRCRGWGAGVIVVASFVDVNGILSFCRGIKLRKFSFFSLFFYLIVDSRLRKLFILFNPIQLLCIQFSHYPRPALMQRPKSTLQPPSRNVSKLAASPLKPTTPAPVSNDSRSMYALYRCQDVACPERYKKTPLSCEM